MRINKLKQRWKAGKKVINGWCHIPSEFSAELMAHMGWDSVCIDTQHGIIDYQVMASMLTALSTTDVTPLVRAVWNEPAYIMKALDAGAYGIICPMINSRSDCERFVQATRYAPNGIRSAGPTRAVWYGGQDYMAHANDEIVTLAMVETGQAVQRLEEILSTPGLDGVYVGPADLSLSLGMGPGIDKTDERSLAIYEAVVAKCRQHDRVPGIHTGSIEYAKRMADLGFDFVTVSGDAHMLVRAGKDIVNGARKLIGEA